MSYRFFLFGACVKAEAAAVFAVGELFGSRSTFDAAVAAFLDVCSLEHFVAMLIAPRQLVCGFCARLPAAKESV